MCMFENVALKGGAPAVGGAGRETAAGQRVPRRRERPEAATWTGDVGTVLAEYVLETMFGRIEDRPGGT